LITISNWLASAATVTLRRCLCWQRIAGVTRGCLLFFFVGLFAQLDSGQWRRYQLISTETTIFRFHGAQIDPESGVHPLGWTGVMPFNWPPAGRVPLQTCWRHRRRRHSPLRGLRRPPRLGFPPQLQTPSATCDKRTVSTRWCRSIVGYFLTGSLAPTSPVDRNLSVLKTPQG
jgi:hypothetical protein